MNSDIRIIERDLNRKLNSTSSWLNNDTTKDIVEVAFADVSTLVGNSRSSTEGDRWCGGSFESICRWVREGAPHYKKQMHELMEEIVLPEDYVRPEMKARRKRRRGEFGNELDIHEVNQGRSDRAWDQVHKEVVPTQGNRLVHMIVDLSANAGVAARDAFYRGAAALRIYDALQRMGKSIAISAYYSAVQNYHPHLTVVNGKRFAGKSGALMASVRVKEYGQPLDEDRLAAVLSMPFLRHCLFTAPYRGTGISEQSHLGFPVSDYNLLTDAAQQDVNVGGSTVVIGQAFTRTMAQQTVDKFLETYVKADAKVDGFTAKEMMSSWGGGDVWT